MPELFTPKELERILRDEVHEAGGAKKWLRKHKLTGFDHALHMLENGSMATTDRLLPVLGFKRVVRYEPTE